MDSGVCEGAAAGRARRGKAGQGREELWRRERRRGRRVPMSNDRMCAIMPMGARGRLRRQGAWHGQAQAGARREGAGWTEGHVKVRLQAGQGRPGPGGAVAQGTHL